jgi:hypothetical protein
MAGQAALATAGGTDFASSIICDGTPRTAEIAQTAESYFFSAPSALSAVIYTGVVHVADATPRNDENGIRPRMKSAN